MSCKGEAVEAEDDEGGGEGDREEVASSIRSDDSTLETLEEQDEIESTSASAPNSSMVPWLLCWLKEEGPPILIQTLP